MYYTVYTKYIAKVFLYNSMNTQVQTKVEELKSLILEMREEGCNKVADLVAEELETLLANEQLVGNKPRRS